jgi:uncharacterized membrane protein YkoI
MCRFKRLVSLTVFAVTVFAVVLAGAPIAGFAYAGQELASSVQVSIDQARAIALKTVPGQITGEELEEEEGGSGLRYTFNIKRGTDIYEVGIDARTGTVLENIVEGK